MNKNMENLKIYTNYFIYKIQKHLTSEIKEFYRQVLYQLYIKPPDDETDLLQSANLITQILSQEDHSKGGNMSIS